MKIFFSVGEPSGDLHGANLIGQLRARDPGFEAVGYGGPRMAEAGCHLHEDLTRLAVMWFLRVLLNLHRFLDLLSRADRYFRHQRPDAVVLIDYPGFNWWIARRARRHGIPVIYYGTPQLWGWASWRVKKMRRYVDHVLCKLPFEVDWYRQRGCQATFLGHPYFDQLHDEQLDQQYIHQQRASPGPLVAILPGSRTQEVKCNLTDQLKTAQRILQKVPDARFAVAAFKPSHAIRVRQLLAELALPAEVHVGKTGELIAAADCALAVSGSVSLELLYHTTPTVIVYRISRLAYFVQAFFRRVRYITLVNLLTDPQLFAGDVGVYEANNPRDAHVLMPEYLTCEDRTEVMAAHIVRWLNDPSKYKRLVEQMAALKSQVAQGGASARAAEYIVNVLGSRSGPVLHTHFPFAQQLETACRGAA